MKKFLVLVFILSFIIPLQARVPFNWGCVNWGWLGDQISQAIKPNFRQATWGMSKVQVKAIEKAKSYGEEKKSDGGLDILAYEGKAGSLECFIAYYFVENQLIQGRYHFLEKHANRILFIGDFRTVKKELTQKYGKPTEDETYWKNDLYKDDSSDWGMAVAVGHLSFQAVWQTPQTKVLLMLTGDNYEITHRLQYSSKSKKHQDLKKEAAKKAKKDIW